MVPCGERQRETVQPPLGEHVDRPGPEPVADRLQGGRVLTGGEPVGQSGEPQPGLPGLPLDPLVPVDPDLGRVGEPGADLDEGRAEVLVPEGAGRPSARCLRMQVLFRRPPARTGRASFPASRLSSDSLRGYRGSLPCMDGVVATLADHEGLPAPLGHDPCPCWLWLPGFYEVSELADLVDMDFGPLLA